MALVPEEQEQWDMAMVSMAADSPAMRAHARAIDSSLQKMTTTSGLDDYVSLLADKLGEIYGLSVEQVGEAADLFYERAIAAEER